MPFKKGVKTPGAGRPGYEYEKEQLDKMKKELSQFLILTERIRTRKAKKEEIEAYQIIAKPICKMMDKLHANKQSIELPSGLKVYLWGNGENNNIHPEKLGD
jgi:hypothetical protein